MAYLAFEGRQWCTEKSGKGARDQSWWLPGHMRDFDSASKVGLVFASRGTNIASRCAPPCAFIGNTSENPLSDRRR